MRSKTYRYTVGVADFETTTEQWFNKEGSTRIWAWGYANARAGALTPMGDRDEVIMGNSGNSFVQFFEGLSGKHVIYFQNLKFDGAFLLHLLLENNYKDCLRYVCYALHHTAEMKPREFYVVGDSREWYAIMVKTDNAIIEFRDSLKRIPMSVADMAREYKLPLKKGSINYDRNPDDPMTDEEREYLRNDVLIVAEVIRQQYAESFTQMTTASYAYENYTKWLKSNVCNPKDVFPQLSATDDAFVRHCYEGGEVWANPDYKGRFIGNPYEQPTSYSLDANSMFPAVYSCFPMPYGLPEYVDAQDAAMAFSLNGQTWKEWRGRTKRYFVSLLSVKATLKPGRIPSVSVPHGFGQREFPTTIDTKNLYLADVRFERLLSDYMISEIQFGLMAVYAARQDLFFDYVAGVMKEKRDAGEKGLLMRRSMAKVKVNAVYGKFGQRPVSTAHSYSMDEDGMNSESLAMEVGTRYCPVAAIITAEARELLISQANKFGWNHVVYMDTDSIHVLQDCVVPQANGDEVLLHHDVRLVEQEAPTTAEGLCNLLTDFEQNHGNEVWTDQHALGAFKIERYFSCGKWLRAKTYFEGVLATIEDEVELKELVDNNEWDGETFIITGKDFNLRGVIKGAGIPKAQKNQITIDNFDVGLVLTGDKLPKRVKGGVILVDCNYIIRADYTEQC